MVLVKRKNDVEIDRSIRKTVKTFIDSNGGSVLGAVSRMSQLFPLEASKSTIKTNYLKPVS